MTRDKAMDSVVASEACKMLRDHKDRLQKSPLDAAIEQINGMGYRAAFHQFDFEVGGGWLVYTIGGKDQLSAYEKTIEEAALNLLDKLKTQKELG